MKVGNIDIISFHIGNNLIFQAHISVLAIQRRRELCLQISKKT